MKSISIYGTVQKSYASYCLDDYLMSSALLIQLKKKKKNILIFPNITFSQNNVTEKCLFASEGLLRNRPHIT